MAVARLGGTVEGRSTHRINFLQRIDELRSIENSANKERDAYQSDLAKILEALGMNSSARPISCHEVVATEVLPEIAKLKAQRPSCSTDHCRLERARIRQMALDMAERYEVDERAQPPLKADASAAMVGCRAVMLGGAQALRKFAATLGEG